MRGITCLVSETSLLDCIKGDRRNKDRERAGSDLPRVPLTLLLFFGFSGLFASNLMVPCCEDPMEGIRYRGYTLQECCA